jgi:hypothetical protein
MKYTVIEGIGPVRQCKVVRQADTLKEAQDFVCKSNVSDDRYKRDRTYQILETDHYEYLRLHQV